MFSKYQTIVSLSQTLCQSLLVRETTFRCINKSSMRCAHFDRKVAIVGAGNVGVAIANTILNRQMISEVSLIDKGNPTLPGEIRDLQHASCFFHNAKILGGSDYSLCKNAQIVVITAGARSKPNETRLDLLNRNLEILKDIVPRILEHNKDPILLLVNNPVDIMTQVAWKLSGLPMCRVIGTGTTLDTARFQLFLSERLQVSPSECHGWIIGEHGENSVVVWSGVTVGGLRLRSTFPEMGKMDDPNDWKRLHEQVIDAAPEIIKIKGYTSWGVAVSTAVILNDIFCNTGCIRAVSTNAKAGIVG